MPTADKPHDQPPTTAKPDKKPSQPQFELPSGKEIVGWIAGSIGVAILVNHFSGRPGALYVSAGVLCAFIAWHTRHMLSLRWFLIPVYCLFGFGTHKYVNFESSTILTSAPVGIYETNYPGWSLQFLLRFGKPVPGRTNYIFDIGGKPDSNRISLYLDEAHELCFRVIDSKGKAKQASVGHGLGTFRIGEVHYLAADYGIAPDFSFVRLLIDGKEVDEHRQAMPVIISKPIEDLKFVMGSDIQHKNGGVFDADAGAMYSTTMSATEVRTILEFMKKMSDRPDGFNVSFQGRQWLEAKQDPITGRFNLINEDPNTCPVYLHKSSN